MTFATFTVFWDPDSSGNFTMSIDYAWSLTNTWNIQFNLEVINPCFETKLNAFVLSDMTIEIGDVAEKQEIAQITDSVGKAQGPILTCGYRDYV